MVLPPRNRCTSCTQEGDLLVKQAPLSWSLWFTMMPPPQSTIWIGCTQEGDLLVKQVQEEMESMRTHYAGMVSELQTKLKW